MKQKTLQWLPLLLVSIFVTAALQAQPGSYDRRGNHSRDYDRRYDDRNDRDDRFDDRNDRDGRYDNRNGRYNQRYEVKKRLKEPRYHRPNRPSGRHIWIGGSWIWNRGAYQYRNGYWAVPRHGHRWVPGHWERGRRGWFWMDGFWTR